MKWRPTVVAKFFWVVSVPIPTMWSHLGKEGFEECALIKVIEAGHTVYFNLFGDNILSVGHMLVIIII